MGNKTTLRGLFRRQTTKRPSDGAVDERVRADEDERVDVDLIIRAARLAVTTRAASETLFVRHLDVTDDVAGALLARLEHCEVIGAEVPGERRRVITTSGELPGVIAEFERRG